MLKPLAVFQEMKDLESSCAELYPAFCYLGTKQDILEFQVLDPDSLSRFLLYDLPCSACLRRGYRYADGSKCIFVATRRCWEFSSQKKIFARIYVK